MTKEIHDINTKAVDFVVELIDYIFEYPDDDYMTMECLCRKLHKHGLLDKADGYYQTHDKTEPSNSEKSNNCEHITEDGVTCAKYPACDDCLDNPLNKVKGSEKLLKGMTEPTISKMEQVDEPKICDTCRCYNSYIPCGSTPSACKKADKFAEEFVDGLKKLKLKDEPKTQMKTQNSNLTFEKADEPQTEQFGVPFGEMDEATFKEHCLNCQRDTADIKCLDCDGNKYFLPFGSQTDCAWK